MKYSQEKARSRTFCSRDRLICALLLTLHFNVIQPADSQDTNIDVITMLQAWLSDNPSTI